MESIYNLSHSLEDYLEVIWDLEEINTVARVKDISERLDVKRSSVTIALRTLSEKGLVNYEPYSVITLTAEGRRVGSEVRQKHNLLRTLFTDLFDIDLVTANTSACLMEHGVTAKIKNKLQLFLKVLEQDNSLRTEILNRMEGLSDEELAEVTELPLLIGLDNLKVNDEGVIHQILGDSTIKKNLHDLGILTGQVIHVISIDEKSGDITIQLENRTLSVTENDAYQILVEKK